MATTNKTTFEEALAAKSKVAAMLATLPASVGITRIGDGYGLTVGLDVTSDALPEQVDGVPIWTKVVGEIRKRLPRKVLRRSISPSAVPSRPNRSTIE